MANTKIEKYQQDLVDNLLEQMQKDDKFLQRWSQIPFNPYNGKGNNLYNGINQINLSVALINKKSDDPRFYTFHQIKELGLKLNKGAKGSQVQYFKLLNRTTQDKNGDDKEVKIPFIRLTHAFNAKDITGLEPYEKTQGFAALKDDRDLTTKLEAIIKNAGVKISHGANRAFYRSSDDSIMMPPPERFSSKESYAATLLHELAHSTGHKSRQNRKMGNIVGTQDYAREELRAELSSVFMCQRLGISYKLENDQSHIENSAAYLKGYQNILKNDKAEFFKAATVASKITDYLVDCKDFEKVKFNSNNKQQTPTPKQQARQAVVEYDKNNSKSLNRGI